MRIPWVLAAICLTGVAAAQTVATPDGRVSVTASGAQQGSGGHLEIEGRLGAFGFENRIEGEFAGDDSYLRVTNPPLNGALLFQREKFERDGTPQAYDESFGPPIAHATIGVGGITAGFDEPGRLTVLGWPGPGMYDHVNFIHVSRGHPNQGAPDNAGSFAGITVPCGESLCGSWLTPVFGWAPAVPQKYASDASETLVTVLEHGTLEMRVTITDVVDSEEDLIARNFRFSCTNGSCPLPATLAYFANMNPTTSRLPRAPSVTDGAADNVSDFGTVYDDARSAMLHFRPYKVDPAALTMLATAQPGIDNARRAVRGGFGPGVYVAVAAQALATEHQAGLDALGLVRSEAEGTPLLDPFYDFADGTLSGSPAAFGKTAGALSGIGPDDPQAAEPSFTVYIAAGATPKKSLALIEDARVRGFDTIRTASEADWSAWISRARLPDVDDPLGDDAETLAVARRALMLIRTAQDRKTGAIVANATVQTPYRQDWVRDGAFFNYALLLAGYKRMVLKHNEFYRRVYRPGGLWDSLYYPDGAEAGLVFPYEIDSQAFALWALWLPYELEVARLEYLAKVYPAIRDTANALLLCQDPINGMQCYAAEDDAVQPTQGAQGASTVYLALRSAARAALELDDEDHAALWNTRADALQGATLANPAICGPETCQGGRGGVYLVWPSRLLDPENLATAARAQSHLQQYVTDLDLRSTFQSPAVGGFFQYPMEPVLALAPFWEDPDRENRLEGWIHWLAGEVAEPGVLHYGERIFRCAGQSPCEPNHEYLHSIGFPHIWSGTEMYLAAAFVHGVRGTAQAPCPLDGTIGEASCQGPP